jgi:hypothetical protein
LQPEGCGIEGDRSVEIIDIDVDQQLDRRRLAPTMFRHGRYLHRPLPQQDHVWTSMGLGFSWRDSGQESRGHIPLAAIISDNRDCLPIIARQHALDRSASFRLEGDPITNLELEHLGVGLHLVKEAKALDNPMVEIDEFCLGQFVNVDRHEFPSSGPNRMTS